MRELLIRIPKKAHWVFQGRARYRGIYGGRSSAKTDTFCQMLLARSMAARTRIVCGRQYQKSIAQSTHANLKAWIERWEVEPEFDITNTQIIHKRTRSEFMFEGFHINPNSIKSISEIDILFLEEAEDIHEAPWRVTPQSIRKAGSEIWVAWNPKRLDSPTRKRMIITPPARARIIKMNWQDNPWHSLEMEEERLADLQRDPDLYQHIWEGECITRSDAKVYGGRWVAKAFAPKSDWHGPYYGLDFGFSTDPTAGVRCWVYQNVLYIDKEFGGVRIPLTSLPALIKSSLPGVERYPLWCDNARPDSIDFLSRNGLPLSKSCFKGPVEDGVEFVRGFEKIVVHPDCVNTIRELDLYSYKVDRLTEQVTGVIVDKDNHYLDAVRYALSPLIRHEKPKLDILFEGI